MANRSELLLRMKRYGWGCAISNTPMGGYLMRKHRRLLITVHTKMDLPVWEITTKGFFHSKGRRLEYSKVFLRGDKKVMRLSHLEDPSGRVSYAQASQRDYHSTHCNGLTVWEIMTEIVSRGCVHGIQICFSEEHTGNTLQKSKVLSSFNDAIRTCYTLSCRDTHARPCVQTPKSKPGS